MQGLLLRAMRLMGFAPWIVAMALQSSNLHLGLEIAVGIAGGAVLLSLLLFFIGLRKV